MFLHYVKTILLLSKGMLSAGDSLENEGWRKTDKNKGTKLLMLLSAIILYVEGKLLSTICIFRVLLNLYLKDKYKSELNVHWFSIDDWFYLMWWHVLSTKLRSVCNWRYERGLTVSWVQDEEKFIFDWQRGSRSLSSKRSKGAYTIWKMIS